MVAYMGKFEKDGMSILRRAHIEGSKRSRFDDKKEGVDGRFIYADVSHKNHLSNWKQFAKWAEEKGFKRIGQIQKKDLEIYVKELVDSGMSKKTIESRIGAVNKIMLYSGRWDNESRVVLSKIEGVKPRELPTKVYKDLTAKEWMDRNQRQYINNRDLIDTVQAFGLRRREVGELNKESFLVDEKGKMYVQTVGKGNKYRIAPVCDSEMNEKMKKLWGSSAMPLEKADEDKLRRVLRYEDQRLNLKGVNGHKMGLHIHRNEYAQRLLKNRIEELKGDKAREFRGYSHLKTKGQSLEQLDRYEVKIGTFKGSARAFMEVSEALGHNRLDVLAKYV